MEKYGNSLEHFQSYLKGSNQDFEYYKGLNKFDESKAGAEDLIKELKNKINI